MTAPSQSGPSGAAQANSSESNVNGVSSERLGSLLKGAEAAIAEVAAGVAVEADGDPALSNSRDRGRHFTVFELLAQSREESEYPEREAAKNPASDVTMTSFTTPDDVAGDFD